MGIRWSPGCRCCNCATPAAVAGCAGGMIVGAALEVFSGGGLSALTSPVFGSGYLTQPTAVVNWDGACAKVGITWTAGGGSSGNSGALNFGGFADDGAVGVETWGNPSHAALPDGITAHVSLNGLESSHYLKSTNIGAVVPAGATPVGFKFEVLAVTDQGIATDETVRLVVGGSIVGSNRTTGRIPDGTYYAFGGPTDLWGLTPTAAQVNASTFGAVISYTDGDPVNGDDVFVDHTRMTVYWSLPGGITGYTIADPGVGGTAATITILPGSDGSGSGASVSATVAARHSESTCTTTGHVLAVRVATIAEGFVNSGWTNGTGYALIFSGGGGTGAAGTFDVVAGHIGNIVLSSGGNNYTSTPTVDFSNAGAGIASGVVTMRASCALSIPGAGRYMIEATTPAGQVDRTCITTTCASNAVGVVNFADSIYLSVHELFQPVVGHSGYVGVAGVSVTLSQDGTPIGTETTDDNGLATFAPAFLLHSGAIKYETGNIDGFPRNGTFQYTYFGAAVNPGSCSYAITPAPFCSFPEVGHITDGSATKTMHRVGDDAYRNFSGPFVSAGVSVWVSLLTSATPGQALRVIFTTNLGLPTVQDYSVSLSYLNGACSPFSVIFALAADLVIGGVTVYAAGTIFTITV